MQTMTTDTQATETPTALDPSAVAAAVIAAQARLNAPRYSAVGRLYRAAFTVTANGEAADFADRRSADLHMARLARKGVRAELTARGEAK